MTEPRILPFGARLPRHTASSQRPAAHLIGVCGSGMKSLAEFLLDSGWRLTGSDLAPANRNGRALQRRGLTPLAGHLAEHVPADVDQVIYSPAIRESNAEREAARRRGIPQMSYPEMLGRLMAERTGIAVAGTHGKSTTTAMLGWILRHAGHEPSVIGGADLLNLDAGGWAGRGRELVVEACEFRRHFLHLSPQVSAILDIEADHFDCFPTLEDAVAAYAGFAARTAADGVLICRAGRPAVAAATAAAACRVETFAFEESANWTAHDVDFRQGTTSFQIRRDGAAWADCVLPLPGRHNVLNALAASALAAALEVSPVSIANALRTFEGTRRRFERLGAWRGIDLVDDFAHHPTAITETLAAARTEFGRRKVWCVFQPHQVSRTLALLEEFARALSAADEVFIPPVYAAREAAGAAETHAAEQLVERTRAEGGRAAFLPSLDQLTRTLETCARPGDVIMMMGAGDIDRVRDEFVRRIPRYHAS